MPQQWIDWQGQTVNGKFKLQEYLGESADSAVFLTNLPGEPSKKAAIKVVSINGNPAEIQLQRWKSAQKLSHPHLVRLFDSGKFSVGSKQFLYVVMEYAEESLSSVLPSRSLTADEAREMLEPTLDALAYIHRQGLVHGHLKPSNLLAVDEQLKISSDGIIAPGEITSLPAKASPYLPADALTGKLSSSADVWALGMTLVEVLTQKRLSSAHNGEREKMVSSLPSPFRKIAESALRTDPERRATIEEMRSELTDARRPAISEPIENQKPPGPRHFFGPAMAVLGIAIIAVATYFITHQKPAEQSSPAPQIAVPVASTAQIPAKPLENSGISTPAKLRQRVSPDVSENALRTVHGIIKVRVKIYVDATGNVERARLETRGPSKYFSGKSLDAAKEWKFDPPVSNGKPVPSEWNLEFQFKRTSAHVRETQTLP